MVSQCRSCTDHWLQVHEAATRALRPPKQAQPDSPSAPTAMEVDTPSSLRAGERVSYLDSSGVVHAARISAVHVDEGGGEPFFSINVEGGSERSTEASRLALLTPGCPSFRSCAVMVLARSGLRPPPSHVNASLLAEPEVASLLVNSDEIHLFSCSPVRILCAKW